MAWANIWAEIGRFLGVYEPIYAIEQSEGAATRVHFIDAGQADATLIEQDGEFALIDVLLEEISRLLFSERKLNTILIGTGRLGRAIYSYLTAEARGYHLMAAFDRSESEIGRTLPGDVPISDIRDLETICAGCVPDVAVLCVPRQSAMQLAPQLVNMGIRGFWNFSHYDLSVDYEGITVENVHLGDSLMTLDYRVRNDQM